MEAGHYREAAFAGVCTFALLVSRSRQDGYLKRKLEQKGLDSEKQDEEGTQELLEITAINNAQDEYSSILSSLSEPDAEQSCLGMDDTSFMGSDIDELSALRKELTSDFESRSKATHEEFESKIAALCKEADATQRRTEAELSLQKERNATVEAKLRDTILSNQSLQAAVEREPLRKVSHREVPAPCVDRQDDAAAIASKRGDRLGARGRGDGGHSSTSTRSGSHAVQMPARNTRANWHPAEVWNRSKGAKPPP
jgi:hypothetical protein